MQAILTAPGDFIVISQDKPFLYVTKLTGWSEDIAGIGSYRKEFRWGTTNRVRASWIDLTQENIDKVILDPNDDLFVDFRITLLSGPPITINNIEIEYEQDPIAKDPYLGFFPVYTVTNQGNISNLTKIDNFLFKPYKVNPLVVLYRDMAMTINQMFGIDVMYARAVPMAIGRDVILSEWTLHDVDEPKCLKVIVPENEFPDSKINFKELGPDFEMPFEVHIVKQYFEEFFGIGTAPQKGDIIYIPLEHRIFEVGSSYLWKDIMRAEVYWKVSLIKYQPKASRKEPTSLRQEFDELTTSYEKEFNEEVAKEELEITKPQQYDPKIGSRHYDPTRETVSDTLLIMQDRVLNYSILISESQYDLRSVFFKGIPSEAVKYRSTVDFPADAERAFTCWFKELPLSPTLPRDNVKGGLTVGSTTNNLTQLKFKISSSRVYASGDYIKITRFNGLTLYGTYQASDPVQGITILVRKEIIDFLNLYYPGWSSSSMTGYVAEKTYENVILDGYEESSLTGFKISLVASRYFLVTRNSTQTLFILKNNIVVDYWYALFINVSNFYRQLTLDLWVRKWNETNSDPAKTTDLENIYEFTTAIIPEDISANTKYRLIGGNIMLTNIRLYNQIETDPIKQINMLNQAIVHDSEYSIIIDNAVPRLKLPWIGLAK